MVTLLGRPNFVIGLQTDVLINCIIIIITKTKHRNPRSKNDEDNKKDYMWEANQIRREISIAKAELERIKANTKITKRGRKNRKLLERECKMISVKHLIEYMERRKSDLRKLKRRFYRRKKQEECRKINWRFKRDPGQI